MLKSKIGTSYSWTSFLGLPLIVLIGEGAFGIAVLRSNFGIGDDGRAIRLGLLVFGLLGERRVLIARSTGVRAVLTFHALVGDSAVVARLLGDGLGENNIFDNDDNDDGNVAIFFEGSEVCDRNIQPRLEGVKDNFH